MKINLNSSTVKGYSFPTHIVVGLVTGKMVSKDCIEGILKIVWFMCGEDVLEKGNLPDIVNMCANEILKMYPGFDDIDTSNLTEETSNAFIKDINERFGETTIIYKLENYLL